jgi:hypothetical protein
MPHIDNKAHPRALVEIVCSPPSSRVLYPRPLRGWKHRRDESEGPGASGPFVRSETKTEPKKEPASPSADNIAPHVLWMKSSALPDIDHQSRVVGEIMSFTGH